MDTIYYESFACEKQSVCLSVWLAFLFFKVIREGRIFYYFYNKKNNAPCSPLWVERRHSFFRRKLSRHYLEERQIRRNYIAIFRMLVLFHTFFFNFYWKNTKLHREKSQFVGILTQTVYKYYIIRRPRQFDKTSSHSLEKNNIWRPTKKFSNEGLNGQVCLII